MNLESHSLLTWFTKFLSFLSIAKYALITHKIQTNNICSGFDTSIHFLKSGDPLSFCVPFPIVSFPPTLLLLIFQFFFCLQPCFSLCAVPSHRKARDATVTPISWWICYCGTRRDRRSTAPVLQACTASLSSETISLLHTAREACQENNAFYIDVYVFYNRNQSSQLNCW